MSSDAWSRLAEPFGPEGVTWDVVARSPDGTRARLAPRPATEALRARLDEVLGPEGWSLRLSAWGADGLIAELTIGPVCRAAACKLAPAAEEAEDRPEGRAVAAAAAWFGIVSGVRVHDDGWVDADPESGEALYLPGHVLAQVPSGEAATARPPPGSSDASAASTSEPAAAGKPDSHAMIDRLVERLRSEGLGAEAARLVTAHGGYGRDAEESRALYAELRALLLQRGPQA